MLDLMFLSACFVRPVELWYVDQISLNCWCLSSILLTRLGALCFLHYRCERLYKSLTGENIREYKVLNPQSPIIPKFILCKIKKNSMFHQKIILSKSLTQIEMEKIQKGGSYYRYTKRKTFDL